MIQSCFFNTWGTHQLKAGLWSMPWVTAYSAVSRGWESLRSARFSQDVECENILHGYLYGGDLLFVILKGIYGFKFPKRFLEISLRDLTSSSFFFSPSANLRTWLPDHWCPFPLHSQGWMPYNQQSNISSVYQTHVFAELHKQNKNWLGLKILLNSHEKERIGCNGGFCKALGADCNLSFGK